jgi:hypothetical protein
MNRPIIENWFNVCSVGLCDVYVRNVSHSLSETEEKIFRQKRENKNKKTLVNKTKI